MRGASATEQGANGCEGVAGDAALPDQVPEGRGERGVIQPTQTVGEGPEEEGPTGVQRPQDARGQLGVVVTDLGCGRRPAQLHREVGAVGQVEGEPAVVAPRGAMPDPEDLARCEHLVEHRRGEVGDAGRQDKRLPGARRQGDTAQLLEHPEQTVLASQPATDGLPSGKEARIVLRRHWLDLST